MNDFQQRVVAEKEELDKKATALGAFFEKPLFATVNPDEQARLRAQHGVMIRYSEILADRIAHFE